MRIRLSVGGTTPITSFFVIERSDDNGRSWVTVQGASRILYLGASVVIDDFEAPREVGLLYRARAVRITASGSEAASAWTTPLPVVLAADGKTWLKPARQPALNLSVRHATRSFDASSEEPQGVFDIEGSPYPIVNAGVIRSASFGTVEIFFETDAAYDAFLAVRNLQSKILFQTCFGDSGKDQWWLRLGAVLAVVRLTTDAMQTRQSRRITVSARAVARPAP